MTKGEAKNRTAALLAKHFRPAVLLLTLLAAVCLARGLCGQPALCPVDYGQYSAVMEQAGLSYTAQDLAAGGLQYTRAITQFEYVAFPWGKLISPVPMGSTVYAIAAVRLFTQPFGLDFSVSALAFLWAALLVLAVYSLAGSGWVLFGNGVLLPGIPLCLIFADGNFCAMLRGLYPQGAAIVFSLLFAAAALRAFTTAAGTGLSCLLPLAAAGILFLRADTALIVFLPAVAAVDAVALWRERKKLPHREFCTVLLTILMAAGCGTAVQSFAQDTDLFSHAAVYDAVFDALLPVSADAAGDLAELGLDESYAADIGLSYYMPQTRYAHCPRDAAQAETLFTALTPARVLQFYARHPQRLLAVLQNLPAALNGYDSARNLARGQTDGQAITRTDGGMLALLRTFWPGSAPGWLLPAGLAALVLLCAALVRRRTLLFCMALSAAGAAVYLPLSVLLCGYDGFAQLRLYQVFLQDAFLLAALGAAVPVQRAVSAWATALSAELGRPFVRAVSLAGLAESDSLKVLSTAAKHILAGVHRLTHCRTAVTLLVLALAVMMAGITEGKTPHAACVNNGDFGRMMNQLGLNWTSENYFDTVSQSNHQAIEQYAWAEPFRWQKLTFLEPTYSLYLFVSLVRPFFDPFGLPLNTWAVALLMAALTVGCIAQLVWDLYPVLKGWTLAAGLGLCSICCCETYLVWYNGLFGEGCVLLGLLGSAGCAVHLALAPRRGMGRWLWFAGLTVSLWVLVCAKSQMLLALPMAIALLGVLLWYHRPYRLDFCLVLALCGAGLCAALCAAGAGIYLSDRGAGSISEKSTLWQTYFYGIFRISDDPIADMKALGVDTAMAPDIGRYVSFDADAEYVYAPLSAQAQTAFYDHVSVGKALQWYLQHPAKLWRMLDHAAVQAHELYTGYRVYTGQDYAAAHDAVSGFALWEYWRPLAAPNCFAGYVLFYGVLLLTALRRVFGRNGPPERRALWCVVLFVMFVGVFQYPLAVLGNGFADNQKEMFGFLLCHDLLVLMAAVLVLRALWRGKAWRGTGVFLTRLKQKLNCFWAHIATRPSVHVDR